MSGSNLSKNIFIDSDDSTYSYGDFTYTARLDSQGDPIEPYILDFSVDSNDFSPEEKERREHQDELEKVWYYPSKRMFVVFYDNQVTEVVHTMTAWSDDYYVYYVEDDKVTHFEESYHGGNRRLTIDYEDGKVSHFSFMGGREFGISPEIGEPAPTLAKLVPDLEA